MSDIGLDPTISLGPSPLAQALIGRTITDVTYQRPDDRQEGVLTIRVDDGNRYDVRALPGRQGPGGAQPGIVVAHARKSDGPVGEGRRRTSALPRPGGSGGRLSAPSHPGG